MAHCEPGEFVRLKRVRNGMPPEALIAEWEKKLGDFHGLPPGLALGSGRQGLVLLLEAYGIEAGDEVIVPAYTLKDLLPLITAFGGIPIPADIDPMTLNCTVSSIAARITKKTKLILALHVFGAPGLIREIVDLGEERGIPVIEDCAHALGGTVSGRRVGTFGAAAFFSFETNKLVNTYGGGMVLSRDEELLARLRSLVPAGEPDLSAWEKKVRAARQEQLLFTTSAALLPLWLLANNHSRALMQRWYRKSNRVPTAKTGYLPVQAELGIRKIKTLDKRVAMRARLREEYRRCLRPEIKLQQLLADTVGAGYCLVALLPSLASPVRRALLWSGIDAGVGEELADDCAAILGFSDCPGSAAIFSRTLLLPFFETLPVKDVERVAAAVNRLI